MNDDCSGAGGKPAARPIPYLSPLAVAALSFGYAVGWGSFVLPGTMFLPNAGPAGTLVGFLIGTAAVVVLAFNYHKMVTGVPTSGGAYGFVTEVFGGNHGFLVGWFLLLTYVAILWANATAMVLLLRYLFGGLFQFGFHYKLVGFDVYLGEVLPSLAAILLCGAVCVFGKRTAVRLHTFFAFVLAGGVAVCFFAALYRHQGGLGSMGPAFSPDSPVPVQILRVLAMVPWAFVGFEAVVQSSSEFRFPVRRTFSLLLAAIIVSALVYMFLVFLPVLALPKGYHDWESYIDALPRLKGIAAMPVFSAAKSALGPLGVAVIGGAMLAGQLTALFASYIAVSRLMRAMADDGMIPRRLGKCNEEGTPVRAVLTVMCVSLPVPFLGRTVIGWPVDLSNLGAAVAYGYISASVLALLKRNGEAGHRAEKAAGIFGLVMSVVFCLLMLVPNYLSGSSLSTESYLLLAAWCFAGFLLYRRVFMADTGKRFGNSTVVWITVLIVIFFSSLMWFRLAVCDSAELAFGELAGKTVTVEMAQSSISFVNADMLIKSVVELCILVASLAVILNLFSILHRREKDLIVDKLKAEESASRSKSYFFSTISHDIRTPLNAIMGYSQMLEMGSDRPEEREQALASILSGGRTLLRLIDDAIDFAKLEDGRLEFEDKPVDCPGLLRRFADGFRRTRQMPGIDFRCKISEMPTLLIDPRRLRQIVFNLTDNAAKFTEKGFIEIRASFDRAEGPDAGTLRIDVEDTGCGIGEADLERITTPYVQVDAARARHGGTGIGLAICLKLAEAMGGSLAISSALGKGSVFTVTFSGVKVTDAPPAALEEEPGSPAPAPAPAAEAPKPAETALSKRILIVDDQKVNLIVLKTMLKKLGISDVTLAKDGKEALDTVLAAETPFDLVLTDMWMPVMDGEGLVRALRAEAKFAALPVHVVTADTEMPAKFRDIGFDGILLKPVTVDKLRDLLG